MKVGDLVRVGNRKTRKGFLHETQVGVVIDVDAEVFPEAPTITVVFSSGPHIFIERDLDIVNSG
jgi:hypothetical protein